MQNPFGYDQTDFSFVVETVSMLEAVVPNMINEKERDMNVLCFVYRM